MFDMTNKIILKIKTGRDWQVRRGHPWVFSGAIQPPLPSVEPGSLVDLHDAEGQFVARGYYNPKTDIAVRVLTRDKAEPLDPDFFRRRIRQAFDLRRQMLDPTQTNVYRLINAEGDFLPGVIVDNYAGTLVLQSHTAGIDRLLEPLTTALSEVMQPQAILLRNDVAVRLREGLTKEEPRLLMGDLPLDLVVRENGFQFAIDPRRGQKTGFFTDQRDKRQALQKYAARLESGATLLNCFSYTAGFSVYAAAAQPALRTLNIDQSAGALELARRNFGLNELDPAAHLFEATDAFKWLEAERERGNQHDLVILDPPAFAKSNREKEKALQGYTRLNRLGLPLVKPGGILLTCSCTGVIGLEEFEGCLREASAATGRSLQILEVFENGLDHPVSLTAPEGRYLKALFCRVL